MSEGRTVLLTGATAQVGLHLLRPFQAAGFTTLALSRSAPASKQTGPTGSPQIHWLQPDQFQLHMQNRGLRSDDTVFSPDILVSAGPLELAVEWLVCCPGLRQLVCLSTTSIFSKVQSGSTFEREQVAAILQAETQLKRLCLDRGLDLCLFRPTLIYGCGMDENISRMAHFIRKFGFLPVAGRAPGLRQPIHVADLAELMMRACTSAPKGQHEFNVTGGSTLSYREMATKVFRALGKPERIVSLPPALLKHMVAAVGLLAGGKRPDPAMVERQNVDLVFDDAETRRFFRFQPRGFEPAPKDFRLPAEIAGILPDWLRRSLDDSSRE